MTLTAVIRLTIVTVGLVLTSNAAIAAGMGYDYQLDYTYSQGNNDPFTGNDYYEYSIKYDSSHEPVIFSSTNAGTITGEEYVSVGSGVTFTTTAFDSSNNLIDSGTFVGSTAYVGTTRAMAYEIDIISNSGTHVPTYVPLTVDWTLKNYLSSEAVSVDPLMQDYYLEQQGANSGLLIGNSEHIMLQQLFSEHGELSQTTNFEWSTDWGALRVGLFANAWSSMALLKDLSIVGDFYTSLALAYADPVIKIDPNWEFVNDYSLSFSYPELQPISQVPVPAAAFLFGPALLGFIGLRRKAKQAA